MLVELDVEGVTSPTKTTDDIQGSTDGGTDAGNGDGAGASNLRTDADLVTADLLLAELG